MAATIRRLLIVAAVIAVALGGTSAGIELVAARATRTLARPATAPHRPTHLAQQSRLTVAPWAMPGGELPRHWQDHGTWWPALGQRGAQTTQVELLLGPTAGWLPCQYGPSGVSMAGRPMTYQCAALPGSAAGAITLVAPLVHTATGWWEAAATDSRSDRATFAVFRRGRLSRASNGRPWWVTPNPVLVRIQPPLVAPSIGLRPSDQQVPAGHPAGMTVTGSHWPAGAYAELWTLNPAVNLTPSARLQCDAPGCQWMEPAPGPGTYEFSAYLHARSGARIASVAQPVRVTWGSPVPTPGASPSPTPGATPTPTPMATPTPPPGVTPSPTPVATAPPPPSSTAVYSNNWSVYMVGSGPYTAATGTFNVPNLYATSTQTLAAEWVGIDGWQSDTALVQTGVTEIYDPSTNLVNFEPWWTLSTYGYRAQPINMAVAPGNVLTATVSEVSSGLWDLTLTNDTTGATFTTEQSYSAPLASAEWIVEDPGDTSTGGLWPFGDYTSNVTFTNLRMNGVETSVTDIVMLQSGTPVSTPSALTAAGFSVAHGSNPPPAP